MEPEMRYKLVVVGDGSVGKTTLILRFTERRFRESYIPTIGVQFTVKEITYEDHPIELVLWDIAGQEQFRAMRAGFYAGSSAAIIAYDITDPISFAHVPNWFEELRIYCGLIPIVLIGNKVDLEAQRAIPFETAEKFAQKIKIPYLETSAKTGENVITVFKTLIKNILEGKIVPPPPITARAPPAAPSDIFSIVNDLETDIQHNTPIPSIIERLNDITNKLFRKNPYSPLLKEISQLQLERLKDYPSEVFSPQDKEHVLLQVKKWQKGFIA